MMHYGGEVTRCFGKRVDILQSLRPDELKHDAVQVPATVDRHQCDATVCGFVEGVLVMQ